MPMHATEEAGARWSWLSGSVMTLARRTIAQMGLPPPGVPQATRGAAMSPDTARRTDPLPFADTEASWHHL